MKKWEQSFIRFGHKQQQKNLSQKKEVQVFAAEFSSTIYNLRFSNNSENVINYILIDYFTWYLLAAPASEFYFGKHEL